MHYLTIGTCGHVDHGKTTLIREITGIDTDSLAEEKRRGLTIDLGFAYKKLNEQITLSFIDVPGHEKFIKNMLAGISGIQFVLLVIDANEGFMPQTYEHLMITDLLNVKDGAVVLSKTDLAEKDFLDLVEDDIYQKLKGSFLENKPLIRFSAVTGEGKSELLSLFESLKPEFISNSEEIVIFPVDRVFSRPGFGTVVTGTLSSGKIYRDGSLVLMPKGIECRVKNIRIHNDSVDYIDKPGRVAINISELKQNEIRRGDVLISPDSYRLTRSLDVKFKSLDKPVKSGEKIHFYHYSSEITGSLYFMAKKELRAGETDFARIKLDNPTIIPFNCNFLIRRLSPNELLGGGRVLNPYPESYKLNLEKRRKKLELYESGDYQLIIKQFVNQYHKTFGLNTLREMIPPEKWHIILDDTISSEQPSGVYSYIYQLSEEKYISKNYFFEMLDSLLKIFYAFHKNYPHKAGLSKSQIQNESGIELIILESLLKEGLKSELLFESDSIFMLWEHKDKIPGLVSENLEKLLNIFENKAFNHFNDLIEATKLSPAELSEQLKLLILQSKIIELKSHVYALISQWKFSVDIVSAYIFKHGSVTVKEAKELLHLSRKYIIPFLETMDSCKITKRKGDIRILYHE